MHKRRLIGLGLIICLASQAHAGVTDVVPSSTVAADASVARTDRWAAFHNPATLIQDSSLSLSAQYENHSLMAELNTASLQLSYCHPYVNTGVALSFFGYSRYQEWQASVSVARSFRFVAVGLQANIYSVYGGDNVGYCTTVYPQLGLLIRPIPTLNIGLAARNPFAQHLKVEGKKRPLPAVYQLGTSWQFLPTFHWDVEVSYDLTSTWRAATAIEWQAIDMLAIKLGAYYYQQFVGCLGVGLTIKQLQLDITAEINPRTGVNLLARIGYTWQ